MQLDHAPIASLMGLIMGWLIAVNLNSSFILDFLLTVQTERIGVRANRLLYPSQSLVANLWVE